MMGMGQIRRLTVWAITLVTLLTALPSMETKAETNRGETVIVGYYEKHDYQEGAGEGAVKKGYAYEYLQKLSEYTGWKYEYVYGTYDELYQKLKNGEIDLLAGVPYTEAPNKEISYPDLNMGYEHYNLMRKQETVDITDNNLSVNGKKIGVVEGDMAIALKQWMVENYITAEVKRYRGFEESYIAFENNETDVLVIVDSNVSSTEKAQIFKTIGSIDYYLGVSKQRKDLLNELNEAQMSLNVDEPYYHGMAHLKYYPNSLANQSLSQSELQWLDSHKEIRVGYLDDYLPFCGTDKEGKVTGMVRDYIPEMLIRLELVGKLRTEYVPYSNYELMIEDLQADKIDISFPTDGNIYYSEVSDVYSTKPILTSTQNIVYKGKYPNNWHNTVAINRNNSLHEHYVKTALPDFEIVYYDSINECLDAVKNGDVSCTTVNGLRASSILKNHKYSNLESRTLPLTSDRCIGVKAGNEGLLRLMNRGISAVGEQQAVHMCYPYNSLLYEYSTLDVIRDNFFLFALGIVVLALAVVVLTLKINNRTKRYLNAQEEWNKGLERQIEIIGGLTNAYLLCYSADLQRNEFTPIKETYLLRGAVEECKTIDRAFAKYLPYGVAQDDMDKMKSFTDFYSLPNRLRSKNVISVEFHGSRPEIEWCRASWIVVGRNEAGEATLVLFVLEEISANVKERKEQEQILQEALGKAEAANDAKSRFLFNMSHDIRTPMNAIIGFTELLDRHRGDPDKTGDYLRKMKSASQFLLSLINNVLEMARIETGHTKLDETTWSVQQFNDTLLSVFSEQMKKKNITFTRHIDVQHYYVICDPVKLREIYLNILSNALKYTPAGGRVDFTLRELPSEKEGYAYYEVVCADTGIGMSKEFLPHLFDEFTREYNMTESKVEGTGLGMPIVKQLVELMGGTIEVESELGKGTTFIVKVHHKISDESALKHIESAKISKGQFTGKRILLAEDNDLNAEIAMEILKEAGFEIERAEDGIICVDMLQKADPGYYDLILMDIQMPNMDGYKATQTIRRLPDPIRRNIAILAMTANAFEEDRQNAFAAGMNGHLSKPIVVDELMATLADTLK